MMCPQSGAYGAFGYTFPTVSIAGVPVSALTCDDFIRALITAGQRREPAKAPLRAGYLNAHTANLAWTDPAHRELLRRFDIVYADGMAIVREASRRGVPLPERVNAGDFLPRFLWAAEAAGIGVAFVGSEPGVAGEAARSLGRLVPGWEPALVHHGHFAEDSAQETALPECLRDSGAGIILAGMGSPRQERWALRQGTETGAGAIWCVGALFEYFAGRRRAPVWARRAGLEWAWRLALEPRRLGARYLAGNPAFLMRAARERRGGE